MNPSEAPVAWPVPPYLNALAALSNMRALTAHERRFGVMIGEAGSGKSRAVREFANSDRSVRVCVVPPKDLCTPEGLLDAIADGIGASGASYLSRGELFKELQFNIRQLSHFVVIDEADRLSPSRLDLLRGLAEGSQGPICLCGTPALEGVIRRISPVLSRVALRHEIRPVSAEDVLGVIGPGAPFAREHGLRTWEKPVLAAAVAESRGNLRQLQVLLAQIDLLERGGAVPQGKSDAFKVALVHRVAEEFLFRAA